MSETILRDCARATDLSYVILRYFNVAGATLRGGPVNCHSRQRI
ncbi:MAG: hypothetical protein CM15mP46_1060 [Alphaproteobacteria bacterium]|nr:MAG: hypothetical protein CM15mP46_1060 [Alphaproteobacteria bacterium]